MDPNCYPGCCDCHPDDEPSERIDAGCYGYEPDDPYDCLECGRVLPNNDLSILCRACFAAEVARVPAARAYQGDDTEIPF